MIVEQCELCGAVRWPSEFRETRARCAASPAEPLSHEEIMKVAREQMDRWRGALDLLADR